VLEIEAKYPLADADDFERRLLAAGAAPVEDHAESDQYFNAPDRDFAKTDEALRVRRIGDANFVTYKGPKRDAQTKTRTEIEVPIAGGSDAADDFGRLLTHLGYRAVAEVRKRRRVFALRRGNYEMHACLDTVDDVGRFVELEIVAPEAELESARGVLLAAAGEFGLGQSERRSYLELLLERKGRA
jgi:adenylate cyclase class 2